MCTSFVIPKSEIYILPSVLFPLPAACYPLPAVFPHALCAMLFALCLFRAGSSLQIEEELESLLDLVGEYLGREECPRDFLIDFAERWIGMYCGSKSGEFDLSI